MAPDIAECGVPAICVMPMFVFQRLLIALLYAREQSIQVSEVGIQEPVSIAAC